jgi:hypothetical protein
LFSSRKKVFFAEMDTFSDNSRCSSFEALTHDPNLSRLAKQMFQRTNDYLNYEVSGFRVFAFLSFRKTI